MTMSINDKTTITLFSALGACATVLALAFWLGAFSSTSVAKDIDHDRRLGLHADAIKEIRADQKELLQRTTHVEAMVEIIVKRQK